MNKVYLAGGFRTNWQQEVKDHFIYEQFQWLDPKQTGLTIPLEYTTWDLFHIKQADIVFVYIEKANPGIGLAAEIGYAKALGKVIITVFEKDRDNIPDKYYHMLLAMSDRWYNNLKEGIDFLSTFIQ